MNAPLKRNNAGPCPEPPSRTARRWAGRKEAPRRTATRLWRGHTKFRLGYFTWVTRTINNSPTAQNKRRGFVTKRYHGRAEPPGQGDNASLLSNPSATAGPGLAPRAGSGSCLRDCVGTPYFFALCRRRAPAAWRVACPARPTGAVQPREARGGATYSVDGGHQDSQRLQPGVRIFAPRYFSSGASFFTIWG